MTDLYSRRREYPVALPFSDLDEKHDTWTNLAHNAEGRAACGWTPAPLPQFDGDTHRLVWDDGEWRIEAIPAEEMVADLEALRLARLAELANIRWQCQQSFAFAGKAMPSDEKTIGLVNAKVAIMEKRGSPPTTSFTWKTAPGVFVPLTLAALIAYGDAIDLHVQACFDREAALAAALLAGDRVTVAGLDITTDWP